MQLTQTRLIVSDFTAAFRYYRDVIGLTPQFADAQPPYAAFKPAEGSALALHDRAALRETIGPELRETDRFLVCLRVENLEDYLAEVTARGGVVVAGPLTQDGRIRTAYLRDPAGNLTELQQWLEAPGGPAAREGQERSDSPHLASILASLPPLSGRATSSQSRD